MAVADLFLNFVASALAFPVGTPPLGESSPVCNPLQLEASPNPLDKTQHAHPTSIKQTATIHGEEAVGASAPLVPEPTNPIRL
jgi:hypothetical protein